MTSAAVEFQPLRPVAAAPLRFWGLGLLAALVVYVSGVTTHVPMDSWDDGVVATVQALQWLGVVFLAVAPLVALRSLPLALGALVPFALVSLFEGRSLPWVLYLAAVCVAMCLVWRRPKAAWVVGAVALVLPVLAIVAPARMAMPYGVQLDFSHSPGATYAVVTSLLYVAGTATALGAASWMRFDARRQATVVGLAHDRNAAEREAAALDERSRLARDLHDVVAHHVSLIAVRAETAPYTVPDLSVGSRAVLADVAEESRQALDELRRVLGVLRRSDDGAELAPQPSATDVPRLVTSAQSASDVVSASFEGLEGVLPAPGLVAYRVVQEALTNARRHAPGEPVDVTVHGDGHGGARVLVTNRTSATSLDRGRGLTGMAERVQAIGGELLTEVRAGEMVVEARLPGGTG